MIPDYYEFVCPVKIISGKAALPNLPYEMAQLGAKRALIVTDKGVVGAGLLKHIQAAMKGAKQKIAAIYDETPVDSSNHVCNQVAEIYRKNKCDCLVAVGGGSAIDTAKGVNIVISEGTDDLMRFQGTDCLTQPAKPLIVIPTTAGTGSEVTSVAVIRNVDAGVKMPFMDQRLYPHVALIDPKMTMTMPPKITAATGMDALTHAVEAYISLQQNPVTDAFSTAAIEMIFENLVQCVEKPKSVKARLAMANAATLAGIAFSNSMVGIVHALAHATGGVCHIPHGVANAILLPYGMAFNIKKSARRLAKLAPLMGVTDLSGSDTAKAKRAIEAVHGLNAKLSELTGLPTRLKDAGVPKEKLAEIAHAAINDGATTYNPEEITEKALLAVLKKAF
jgi:alcohol dehydrogenase